MEAESGLCISTAFSSDTSQMQLRYLHFTRKLKFLRVGTLPRLNIPSRAMKTCLQKWIRMPHWKTRNKHITQCNRDNLQTDMEYTYLMLVVELKSRKGVCSIGSPYHVHVCVLVAGCYRTVYIYDCTICLDDSVKVASPYLVHY